MVDSLKSNSLFGVVRKMTNSIIQMVWCGQSAKATVDFVFFLLFIWSLVYVDIIYSSDMIKGTVIIILIFKLQSFHDFCRLFSLIMAICTSINEWSDFTLLSVCSGFSTGNAIYLDKKRAWNNYGTHLKFQNYFPQVCNNYLAQAHHF